MRHRQPSLWLALIASPFLAGCGGNRMADVRVKILCGGSPVTAGSVVFAPEAPEDQPEAGRPASGAPDENGELQLSTYKKDDGALVGRHKVSYLAPGPPTTIDAALRDKQLKLYEKFGKCRLPAGYVVELKPGKNDITLELIRDE